MSNGTGAWSVLIVEDSDAKYLKLEFVVRQCLGPSASVIRGATVNDAEEKLETKAWNLVLLDISMDITSSKKGPKLGGHATLGGLSIATKMFLLGREAPTIIVTAYDSFETIERGRRQYSIGLEEIERRAKETLGNWLVGCVRYGNSSWENVLQSLIKGIGP